MTETEITFDAVRQRWSESMEALEALHGRLATLGEAEERQTSAADSLDAAAAAMHNSAISIDGATEVASSALTQLQATLEAAHQLLDGEPLRNLRQAMTEQQSAFSEDLNSLRNLLSSKLEALESEREEAREQRDVLQRRVDQLESAIARIPKKQRQKLNQKFGLS